MFAESVEGAAALLLGGPENVDRNQDKHRRNGLGQPCGIKCAKHGLETHRDGQGCHARAHPARKGAFVCQNGSVFGPIRPVFCHFIAIVH